MNPKSSQKISILLFAGIFLFAACSKKDEGVPPPSKTVILTASSWKLGSAGIGTSNLPIPASYLPPCDADNKITFKSDKTGVVDEGASKCDPGDPQTYTFTWDFANNETEINFSTPVFLGMGGVAKIIDLSATKFTFSMNATIPDFPVPGVSLPVTIIVALVH